MLKWSQHSQTATLQLVFSFSFYFYMHLMSSDSAFFDNFLSFIQFLIATGAIHPFLMMMMMLMTYNVCHFFMFHNHTLVLVVLHCICLCIEAWIQCFFTCSYLWTLMFAVNMNYMSRDPEVAQRQVNHFCGLCAFVFKSPSSSVIFCAISDMFYSCFGLIGALE